MEHPHILVTNDDGIDADALLPLSDALSTVGDVDIIVPEWNWSGASHSITLRRPLRVVGIVRIGRSDACEEVLVTLARKQVAVLQRLLAELGQEVVAL